MKQLTCAYDVVNIREFIAKATINLSEFNFTTNEPINRSKYDK